MLITVVAVPASLGAAMLICPVSAARRRLSLVTAAGNRPTGLQVPEWLRRTVKGRSASGLAAVAAGLSAAAGTSGLLRIPLALAAAAGAFWACRRFLRARGARADPLALAAGWDLFAVCLRAGVSIPDTMRAAAAEFTGPSAAAFREVADLLALGADHASAWRPALQAAETAELARAARRTGHTGSALAHVGTELAKETRAKAGEYAEACAQRAAVWVAAPLGLCFLPAFLCLGVLPVAVGMASHLTVTW